MKLTKRMRDAVPPNTSPTRRETFMVYLWSPHGWRAWGKGYDNKDKADAIRFAKEQRADGVRCIVMRHVTVSSQDRVL